MKISALDKVNQPTVCIAFEDEGLLTVRFGHDSVKLWKNVRTEDMGCWYNDAHVHQSALREGGRSVDLAARLVNKDHVTRDDRGGGELHARLSSPCWVLLELCVWWIAKN